MKNTKHTEMNDSSIEQENQENLSQSKRKILTSIGVTSGVVGASALVPSTWVKPAVNSIVLPAHAQSTPPPTTMAPTTMAPTTMAPTTMAPTTMAPTTMAPASGRMINVQGYPTSGMVGDDTGTMTYHVSLSDAPTPDSETGSTTVTVSIEIDPLTSVDANADPVDIMFDSSNYMTTQVLTALNAVEDPGDDPVVTVTFTASGGGYDDVTATAMFTIVEDDNIAPTDVEAEAGDVDFMSNSADVTVTWTAPDTTATVTGYVVSTEGQSGGEAVDDMRVTGTSAVFEGLTSGIAHVFSVVAHYDEGSPSPEAMADSITIGA